MQHGIDIVGIGSAFGGAGVNGPEADCWRTPSPLIESLQDIYGPFTLDAAADAQSAVAPRWLGPGSPDGEDALEVPPERWAEIAAGGLIFCNPPFSQVEAFTQRCADVAFFEALAGVIQIVKVVPETKWWAPIWAEASYIFVPDRRINFVPPPGRKNPGASHAHAIVLWSPNRRGAPIWSRIELDPSYRIVKR